MSSSIIPGMIAVRAISNDTVVGFGGGSGYLEMNACEPLMLVIYNIEGTKPNRTLASTS